MQASVAFISVEVCSPRSSACSLSSVLVTMHALAMLSTESADALKRDLVLVWLRLELVVSAVRSFGAPIVDLRRFLAATSSTGTTA